MSGQWGTHPRTGQPVWIETGHVDLDRMLEVYFENRKREAATSLGQARLVAVDTVAAEQVGGIALEFAGIDPDLVLTVAMQVIGRAAGGMAAGLPVDMALTTAVAMWAGKVERPEVSS